MCWGSLFAVGVAIVVVGGCEMLPDLEVTVFVVVSVSGFVAEAGVSEGSWLLMALFLWARLGGRRFILPLARV